jgi:heme O synthase-like polyprenyltransferase
MVMPLQCTVTGIVFDVPGVFVTEFQDKLAPFLLLQVSSLRYFCSYSNVLKQTTGT